MHGHGMMYVLHPTSAVQQDVGVLLNESMFQLSSTLLICIAHLLRYQLSRCGVALVSLDLRIVHPLSAMLVKHRPY